MVPEDMPPEIRVVMAYFRELRPAIETFTD